MGRTAWLAAWAFALTTGCGGSSFACRDDAQCVLAGIQGVCQPGGDCSYPDEDCPSGYRYPPAAGGQCVPGDAMTTSATSTQTGTMSSTTGATASNSATVMPPDTDAVLTEPPVGPTTGPPPVLTDSFGETDEPPPPGCQDPQETPDPLLLGTDQCEQLPGAGDVQEGVLAGGSDVDVYIAQYPSVCTPELVHGVFVNSDEPMVACAYFQCADPVVVCEATDDEDTLDGFPGCCSPMEANPQPRVMLDCGGDLSVHITISNGPAGVCAPYLFVYAEELPPE